MSSRRRLDFFPGNRSRAKGISVLVAGLFWALMASSSVSAGESGAVPVFSGDRAMSLLQAQCELGPRMPGSVGNTKLREMIVGMAREQGFAVHSLCFEATDPLSGEPIQVCNIVVSAGPEGGERLWLGAHYDTRPVSDQDALPELRTIPLTGANDGASGVAVLLHLLEILGANPPPGGVDLLFFDGEDSGLTGNAEGFCLGSRHLAQTWRDFGNPLSRGNPRGLIVLDMVGKKNLQIPMEAYAAVNAPEWTETVFQRAEKLGLGAFVPQRGPAIYDDHVPFLQQGIPAVDLIDFDFPEWHTTGDTPEVCSGASLEEVGRLMVDLIYRP